MSKDVDEKDDSILPTALRKTWGLCLLCRDSDLHPPYKNHGTFCPACVLTVCGKCWSARTTETWSTQRRHQHKPLLLSCPNCGWHRRIKPHGYTEPRQSQASYRNVIRPELLVAILLGAGGAALWLLIACIK